MSAFLRIPRFLKLSRGASKRLERWSRPLRNIFTDYVAVATDLVQSAKKKPIKFIIICTIGTTCAVMWRKIPDMDVYRDEVVQYSNELSQCSELTRNPRSQLYIEKLLLLDCSGSLRYINLGLCSVILERPNYKDCYNFTEVCPHLQPQWWTTHRRLIDVGFWNKWWLLEQNMTDFDVNEDSLSDCK